MDRHHTLFGPPFVGGEDQDGFAVPQNLVPDQSEEFDSARPQTQVIGQQDCPDQVG